jgi:hypothetical protein
MSDIVVKKQATPTLLPDAGEVSIYISSTTNAIETVDDAGTVTTYATPGTTLTTENVQDIVGAMTANSTTVVATYNDPANTITYDVDATGIDHSLLQNIGTNSHTQIDTHIANTSNPHSVTKSQVGLGNADNTSDLNKPISTATQTALNSKEPTITSGTTSQYFRGDKTFQTLDKAAVGLGNVPNVDATVASNITQDANHRFVTDTEKTTWNSKEAPIATGTTAQYWRGDKSWQTLDKTAVGLANVDNTSDLNKPISTATQTALNGKENSITSGTTSQFFRGDKTFHTIDTSYLTDFSVSSPQLDEVLKWNGVAWINGAGAVTGAGAGVAYFFTATASDVSGYDYMQKTPDNVAEVIESVSVDSTTSPILVDPYISDVPFHKTTVDAGIWNFNIYSYVSSLSGTTSINLSVYSRTTAGVETLLFTTPSVNITNTAVSKYTLTTAQPTFTVAATDRLVFKLYASHSTSTPVTLSFVHSGTTHYSYVETPLILAHNDLGGLQGGTTGQQYHLTQTEYTGTGTGNFVRASGATLSSPSITTPTGITKSDVGLGNVVNIDTTNPANITQDANHRFVTDTEKTTWNGKQDAITGAATTITSSNLTVSRALVSDASGKVAISTVTSAELANVSGVTSAIQTQLNAKEPTITAGTTSQYYRGDKTFQTLDKTSVGLGNVDNTSDLNKPISTATQTALNSKEASITAGTTAQYWRGDKSWQTLNSTSVGLGNVNNTADTAKTIAGDVSGTLGASTVDKIKGVAISATAPSTGQVLTYTGSTWSPATPSGGGSSLVWDSVTVSASTLALTSASNKGKIFVGTVGGQVVTLPDATTLTLGDTFYFVNKSDPLVNLKDAAGTFQSFIIPTKEIKAILVDNTSVAGIWNIGTYGIDYGSFRLYDDFVSASATTNQIGALGWTITSGTVAYQVSAGASNGVIRVNTGTGNATAGALNLGTASQILLNNSVTFCEQRISFPAIGGTAANQLSYCGGLLNAATNVTPGTNPLNAIGFSYQGTAATAANIFAFSSNAATTTTLDTTVQVVAGTWYKASFIVNAAGTVAYFYLNNTYIGTINTNLPTAIVMAPMVKMNSGSTNAAAKAIDVDYYDLQKLYTTIR